MNIVDYIVENRVGLGWLFGAVLQGLMFSNMSVKGWKGKAIKYSVGGSIFVCVVQASDFIKAIF